jgi:predicted pyridoxine 5'-phosphate oxidase superfamily flavin-nucleotide-binding protein
MRAAIIQLDSGAVLRFGQLQSGGIIVVSIPKHVQEFLPGKLAWVATASGTGEPNVTPKGSLKLLDENHVLFADLFSLKTRRNLLENNKVAVTVIDAAKGKGYQIKGTAEVVSSGPLFDETCKQIKAVPKALPPVQHVVKITVESVFDQSVGPDAGKQIA